MAGSLPNRRREAFVLVAFTALAAATILYSGFADRTLGVPLPPFSARPDSSIGPLVTVAAVALAAAVAAVRAALTVPLRWFLPASFAAAVVLRLAVNAARGGGPAGWTESFDLTAPEGPLEYLAGREALTYGASFLLDRFAELVPSLPVHVAGHPPGLLVLMDALAIDTAGGLAALCIGVGALSAPLTYTLALRSGLDDTAARLAAVLFTIAPGPVLMGATSADALYCTLALAAATLLLRRRAVSSRSQVVAGAVMLAVASLFSWALLAAGAFAVCLLSARRQWRDALAVAAACAIAVPAFHAALWAATGWDPIGTIQATESVYRLGIASIRPYAFWIAGSPVAALLFAGVPLTVAFLIAAARGEPAALALAAIVVTAAVLGFSKAETERIWLFMVPWLCVAAAAVIPPRWGAAVAAVLAVQALSVEVLVDTVW